MYGLVWALPRFLRYSGLKAKITGKKNIKNVFFFSFLPIFLRLANSETWNDSMSSWYEAWWCEKRNWLMVLKRFVERRELSLALDKNLKNDYIFIISPSSWPQKTEEMYIEIVIFAIFVSSWDCSLIKHRNLVDWWWFHFSQLRGLPTGGLWWYGEINHLLYNGAYSVCLFVCLSRLNSDSGT